ncbi:MAG: cupin domain-containing protein [Patescibacteria group bacterium]|nr:cupin domain-containing protein [Patescibacteria group bacterium]
MKNLESKNNKFFAGNWVEAGKEHRGWFIGSFFEDGSPLKTNDIEVFYCEHRAGDRCRAHYHQKKVEVILFLEGNAKYAVNGSEIILKTGDFLFVDRNNVIEGEFLEPTKIISMHSPSIATDKVVI